ncbi:MAG: hypothetical protein FWC94_03885, partial [Bacteroidales bacterium]|nr:hypothetical protein [Bacteroidales bacterium]
MNIMKRSLILIILASAVLLVPAQSVIHVSPSGSSSGPGADWAGAVTLEHAVSTASAGDILWVRYGTYHLSGTLEIPDNVRVYGGFLGTETHTSQRNFALNPTIIDAGGNFGAVTLGQFSVLSGFTVRGGVANIIGRMNGGGVVMLPGSRLEYSRIEDNTAAGRGGGVWAQGQAEIFSSVFSGNRAGLDGFAVSGGQVLFLNNTVVGNTLLPCTVFDTVFFDTICTGSTLALSTSIAGTYLWNTGETGSSITTPVLTADSVFWVKITTPDLCAAVHSFNIHVLAQTLALTSAVGTDHQQIALGDSITWIAYTFGGVADSVRITWQGTGDTNTAPAGITVSDRAVSPIIIRGTPAHAGIFVYTITTIGSQCDSVSLTGTINAGMRGCNLDTPGWGASLGTIAWGSTANTDIESGTTLIAGTGSRPAQVWSGAVFASACEKGNDSPSNEFNGGTPGNFNADCRQTLGSFLGDRDTIQTGDLFSWCAVMRFGAQLCPYPWRVPTQQDFAALHQNLGYAMPSVVGGSVPLIANTYTGTVGTTIAPQVGGLWNGSRFTSYTGQITSSHTLYWSSTEIDANSARSLYYTATDAFPAWNMAKFFGLTLRCVRDEPCDIITFTGTAGTSDQAICMGQAILPISFDLVEGTSGSAIDLAVRWFEVSADAVDTTAVSTPSGITYLVSNLIGVSTGVRGIAGTPANSGHFIFEVFTTDHDEPACDTARLRGTINISDIPCPGCNNSVPGWGASLGTITWGNTSNTNIESGISRIEGTGGRLSQVWSGAVFASACEKNEFNGGTTGNFNADCRQSLHTFNNGRAAGITGDYFSWCAVMRFGNQLCPYPWRVPTSQDFIDLDMNLGGTGMNSQVGVNIIGIRGYTANSGTNIAPTVGGIWGGVRFTAQSGFLTQESSLYWSSTASATGAYLLGFSAGHVHAREHTISRSLGLTLRCIRDYECDILVLVSDSLTLHQTVGSGQIIAPVIAELAAQTLGTATMTDIRWFSIDSIFDGTGDFVQVDTNAAAMPTGLSYNGNTHTLTGSTALAGRYIFEIFTTNHIAPCDEAILRGTLTVTNIPMTGCNSNTPGFGGGATGVPAGQLGTITWGNTTNTTIESGTTTVFGSDGRPAQIWSGAVFAAGCAKGIDVSNDEFNGGTAGSWNADCRQTLGTFNTGRAAAVTGDLFSWCAVMRFGDVLCPDGWRVPTTEDFAILHQNLGYALPSTLQGTVPFIANTYVGTDGTVTAPQIGGPWGGARWTGFAAEITRAGSGYWSSTEISATNALLLYFSTVGVWPQFGGFDKGSGFALRCVRDYVVPQGCNSNEPGFGPNLGTITWGNTSNTDIESGTTTIRGTEGRPAQTWSGAVFATACAKGTNIEDAFNGGTTDNFNADCRQTLGTFNSGRPDAVTGDLFSWCAVMRFADMLCPDGWRVPTTEDFAILHRNLGHPAPPPFTILPNTYVGLTGTVAAPEIGGIWGGARWTGGATLASSPPTSTLDHDISMYWSSTESSAWNAHRLLFHAFGVVHPEYIGSGAKSDGLALRCVRDTVFEPIPASCNDAMPGFGPSLGTVTWGNTTNEDIEIGRTTIFGTDGRPTQVWSGAVFAANCAKGNTTGGDEFNGGTAGNFNADCRQSHLSASGGRSSAVSGDFFSWCAVMRFAGDLCPYPWRVPTSQEFIDLDMNMGGTGLSRSGAAGTINGITIETQISTWYTSGSGTPPLPQIGGLWGGSRWTGHAGSLVSNTQSYYWSSTEASPTTAHNLSFWPDGISLPATAAKSFGRVLRCIRDYAAPQGCNTNEPGWGTSLGTITRNFSGDAGQPDDSIFISGQVHARRISQIWSGPVMAENCNKTTFAGGTDPDNFNADCRRSHDVNRMFPDGGDLFSWCAVTRFAEVLCPYPWRVPTEQDFINLDSALGGTGSDQINNPVLRDRYIATTGIPGQWWRGVYSGTSTRTGTLQSQNVFGTYWSQSLQSPSGIAMTFSSPDDQVRPRIFFDRGHGLALRCVKDGPEILPMTGCNSNTPGFGGGATGVPAGELGTVSWGNVANTNIEEGTTTIRGTEGRPSQVWSGEVFAAGCAKGNASWSAYFNGGPIAGTFNADCRQSLNAFFQGRPAAVAGDYFSWCAVMRFADVLCPDGWRVPTQQDFINLDMNLGGTGENNQLASARPVAYTPATGTGHVNPQIGGTWRGVRWTVGTTSTIGDIFSTAFSAYWSSIENSATQAFNLFLDASNIHPQHGANKSLGLPLRCVRDTVFPPPPTGCNDAMPGWGPSLGTISWGNTANTDIETGTTTIRGTDGRPAQTWSGAVFAAACEKGNDGINDSYNGGTVDNWNADCRQTLGSFLGNRDTIQTGDLFSWCAVMRFADDFCPYPWRVPDSADFRILHENLGYQAPTTTGNVVPLIPNTFTGEQGSAQSPMVGGIWGGALSTGLPNSPTSPASGYWMSTEITPIFGRGLRFGLAGVWLDDFTKSQGLALRCIRDTIFAPIPASCNDAMPGWGPGLLGADFATDQTWTIHGTGGRATQEWSDAVVAAACAGRETFDGGSLPSFNADCRNSVGNANFSGHYFSWCAVMRFEDELCPYPWRVPTQQDFIDLDLNLGGTGLNSQSGTNIIGVRGYTGNANSPNGGVWGGSRFTGSSGGPTAAQSFYWSSTEHSAPFAFILHFNASYVYPQNALSKGNGFAVRCVRDYACDILVFTVDSAAANQTVGSGQTIAPVTVGFVGGTLGTATTTDIRWFSIDSIFDGTGDFVQVDTNAAAMPTGLSYNGNTHTLTGSTALAGRYIFEIFTTNHIAPCDEAVVRGTLTVTPISMIGCNSNTPLFGGGATGVPAGELGTVTWGTTTNIDIEEGTTTVRGTEGRPSQTWSGAVF